MRSRRSRRCSTCCTSCRARGRRRRTCATGCGSRRRRRRRRGRCRAAPAPWRSTMTPISTVAQDLAPRGRSTGASHRRTDSSRCARSARRGCRGGRPAPAPIARITAGRPCMAGDSWMWCWISCAAAGLAREDQEVEPEHVERGAAGGAAARRPADADPPRPCPSCAPRPDSAPARIASLDQKPAKKMPAMARQ